MAELFKSWQEVAHILGAELDYADQREAQTRTESLTMRVRHRHWTIAFESKNNQKGKEKAEASTRIFCPLAVRDAFAFNIFEERLKHRLFKIMGLQDIVIGDPALDRRFVFQASHEEQLRQFLGNPLVRAGFASPAVQQLRLGQAEGSDEGPGDHQLSGRSEKRLHAKGDILAHFQLFAAALDGLHALDLIAGHSS